MMSIKKSREAFKQLVESTKEALLLTSQIDITGNNHAVIQGARGILEYNEDMVRIKLVDCEICFWGQKLIIDSLSQDSMEIKGKIQRVEYSS